jgi:hypothetical protein
MSILSEVQNIGPDEALKLEASAKAGDLQAAVRFMRFAVWRKLRRDRVIPARLKPKLFKAILKTIPLTAEAVKAHG